MKITFELASWAQKQAGLSVDAAMFLELEQSSKTAMAIAVADSIDRLGPESPVWPHIESLIRDFGQMPVQSPGAFEALLKVYFVACFKQDKEVARKIWAEVDRQFTDHTGDKAFRRLVERNAEVFCGVTYRELQQEHINRFIEVVRTADAIEWVAQEAVPA